MKTGRLVTVAAAGIAASIASISTYAFAQGTPLKALMGENFASVQSILASLITSNYATVDAQVDVIQRHAVELKQMVPESAQADRDRFLLYAYELQGHAEGVRSITAMLIQHDEKRGPSGTLNEDHLREALAAHYGGMVTTCVACHNRFRRRVIR